MSTQKKISFIKSNVLGRKPTPDKMLYGEIAINFNSQDVDMFTKNSDNEVVSVINDSNFAKYFSEVKKGENISHLYTSARFNVVKMTTNTTSYNLTIDPGKIIGNEVNAIFVNETANDVKITVPVLLNGCTVKSFDGFEIIVPNNTNDVNMVEVNLVFDGDTYYVRIA